MGIPVLGPDVNESFYKFTVNNDNAIRFGMGAIKGVGQSAVDSIVASREEKPYLSLFDMTKSCLLYTSPSPRDLSTSRMPSSA